MLFLDRVYVDDASSVKMFCWVKAPTNREVNQLSHVIAHRLARYLERQGLLEKDVDVAAWLPTITRNVKLLTAYEMLNTPWQQQIHKYNKTRLLPFCWHRVTFTCNK